MRRQNRSLAALNEDFGNEIWLEKSLEKSLILTEVLNFNSFLCPFGEIKESACLLTGPYGQVQQIISSAVFAKFAWPNKIINK
jgi:hypothetical protein